MTEITHILYYIVTFLYHKQAKRTRFSSKVAFPNHKNRYKRDPQGEKPIFML